MCRVFAGMEVMSECGASSVGGTAGIGESESLGGRDIGKCAESIELKYEREFQCIAGEVGSSESDTLEPQRTQIPLRTRLCCHPHLHPPAQPEDTANHSSGYFTGWSSLTMMGESEDRTRADKSGL